MFELKPLHICILWGCGLSSDLLSRRWTITAASELRSGSSCVTDSFPAVPLCRSDLTQHLPAGRGAGGRRAGDAPLRPRVHRRQCAALCRHLAVYGTYVGREAGLQVRSPSPVCSLMQFHHSCCIQQSIYIKCKLAAWWGLHAAAAPERFCTGGPARLCHSSSITGASLRPLAAAGR